VGRIDRSPFERRGGRDALTPSFELIVFPPTAEKYAEQARIKVANSPTYAYPVVSGNRVYGKDQDSLTLWTID
jgi:hypothetical protein